MYKIANEFEQDRISRLRLRDLENGDQELSSQQEYEALSARAKQLQMEIDREADKETKKRLCRLLDRINKARHEHRRRVGIFRGRNSPRAQLVPHFFMDAARELMTPAQFNLLLELANDKIRATIPKGKLEEE